MTLFTSYSIYKFHNDKLNYFNYRIEISIIHFTLYLKLINQYYLIILKDHKYIKCFSFYNKANFINKINDVK